MKSKNEKILARLKKIEGQVRGLQRLIEKQAPCVDVLTQVSAVTSAMKKTGAVIIANHMDMCMNNTTQNREKERNDFQIALARFIDLS